jgi:hypothetical protein
MTTLELLDNLGSMNPTSSSLPVDVHGNSSQTSGQCQTPDHEESLSNTLIGNPIVDIKRQSKRKRVFDKVHDGECLGCLISMCVDHIGNNSGSTELNTEIDQTQAEDYWNWPWILGICGLTPSEESDCREHQI